MQEIGGNKGPSGGYAIEKHILHFGLYTQVIYITLMCGSENKSSTGARNKLKPCDSFI